MNAAKALLTEPPRWAHVERQASRLRDPVARLRYLQTCLRQPALLAPARERTSWAAFVCLALMLAAAAPTGSGAGSLPARPRPSPASPPPAAGEVWLVERTAEFELYSNGLRVERAWCVRGEPRSPRWLARNAHATPQAPPDPAGLVFHASENDPAPFAPPWTNRLKQQGESLLGWVQRHALYHYVVDRFGRVFRILEDSDRAHHAGRSLWADANGIYLDLNESFLAVCFEASTENGGRDALTAAQIHAGRLLVEMLRTRYRLPPGNCVTHAQVSVNPANGRIGYHTDWADGFPFLELGLPDNYSQPLPALLLFGFRADQSFLNRAGPRLREAVRVSEEEVSRQARSSGLPVEAYRRELAASYRRALRVLTGT
jgi:hypothetical protein